MLITRGLLLAVFAVIIAWAVQKFDWPLIWAQLRAASIPLEIAMAAAWLEQLRDPCESRGGLFNALGRASP